MIRASFILAAFLAVVAVPATARDAVSRSSEAQWLDQMAASATLRNRTTGTGAGPSTYAPGSNGAYAKGTKELPWPGKAGANNLAAWKAKARGADLARALMNPGSAALTLVGGMAVKQLIDLACVQVFGGTISEGDAWQECNFVDKPGKEHKLTTEFPPRVHQWVRNKVAECTALGEFVTTKNNNGVTYVATIEPANLQPDNTNGGTCVVRNPNFPASCSGSGCLTVFTSAFTSRDTVVRVQEGYKPADESVVEPKIAAAFESQCQSDFTAGLGADSTCPRAFAEVVNAGIPVEVDDAELEVPVHVEGPCTTVKRTNADGSYSLTTTCSGADYDDTGNTVQRVPKTTEKVEQFDANGNKISETQTGTETTTDQRTACEKDPNSQECANSIKVQVPNLNGTQKAEEVLKPLRDFAANPTQALPQLPVLNWAFVLPSGCTPIALPAFEPWLQVIDICPFVSMFHDIMTVIWIMGGLFGAISLYWRNTLSQA